MLTVYFISYISGSGGNFLGRVLSLDEKVVGMGADGLTSTLEQRRINYNYSTLPFSYNEYSQHWVNYELEIMYLPLKLGINKLLEINAKIIEPIEPENFYQKLKLFDNDDQLIYLHIDISNCINWVNRQRKHKGAHNFSKLNIPLETTLDIIDLDKIVSNYKSYPISLEKIILSEEYFLIEYEKICNYCKIKNYNDIALEIYRSWKGTWANVD